MPGSKASFIVRAFAAMPFSTIAVMDSNRRFRTGLKKSSGSSHGTFVSAELEFRRMPMICSSASRVCGTASVCSWIMRRSRTDHLGSAGHPTGQLWPQPYLRRNDYALFRDLSEAAYARLGSRPSIPRRPAPARGGVAWAPVVEAPGYTSQSPCIPDGRTSGVGQYAAAADRLACAHGQDHAFRGFRSPLDQPVHANRR